MTPSVDQQEQMKMAQRSQRKLAQGFQMYTYFIATGSRIDEALEKMEAAMESWTDYEDRHTIDMPAAFDMNALMGTLGKMADTMGKRAAPQVDAEEPMTPEEICEAEQLAWDEYQTSKRILGTIAPDAVDRETFERMTSDAERQWRSFGTASLRLQLAAAQCQTTDPPTQHDGGLPK